MTCRSFSWFLVGSGLDPQLPRVALPELFFAEFCANGYSKMSVKRSLLDIQAARGALCAVWILCQSAAPSDARAAAPLS